MKHIAAGVTEAVRQVDVLEVQVDFVPNAPSPQATSAVVHFLKEGIERLGVRELRLQISPESLGAMRPYTADFLRTASNMLEEIVEINVFAMVSADHIEDSLPSFLRDFNAYANIELPTFAGPTLPPDVAAKLCVLLEACEAAQLHRPAVQLIVDPTVDIVGRFRQLIGLGFRSIDLRMPDRDHVRRPDHPVEHYGAAMIALFEDWIGDDDPNVMILFFHDILHAMKIGMLPEEEVPNRTGLERVHLAGDGNLAYATSRFTAEPASANIGDGVTLAGFLGSHRVDLIRQTIERPAARCSDCCWWGVCGGGELQHRSSSTDGFALESVFCDAIDALFTAIAAKLIAAGMTVELISNNLDSLRLGVRPDAPVDAATTDR